MASQSIQDFFHPVSGTISYVVADKDTNEAIVIDPVADYDVENDAISYESAQEILAYVETHQLHIVAILETHIHTDHLSGSFYLSKQLQVPIYVSEGVKEVYADWKEELCLSELYHFEHFLLENEQMDFGHSHLEVINTPGHTRSDVSFKIGDALFVGDSLSFHNTGNVDVSGGNAEKMFESIRKLYALKDSTEVYLGHDCLDSEGHPHHKTTIGEEKHQNEMLNALTSKQEFVDHRVECDQKVTPPKLIKPALEFNLTALHSGV
ncbi:MBL fold metallo-hydrolase [Vibrio tubiashii]|uniref:MBL fold metallo-hydrolase n=1 Tax=Vibrio tubiashii TaxID=29498 RepID=UPI001EFC8A28|nr:MBL fold metallo-hydrolase [Vibrio tubiashii]MCG9580088.1 MBL fold metallo-hydrolase [Vibrio tubiashii]MCG9613679.1 MBL fold metallo-hydrolase [Vibrio tubiashii]MCG9686168.1 MBL fold metallo-hydrolase [Vibrio tubiashii]